MYVYTLFTFFSFLTLTGLGIFILLTSRPLPKSFTATEIIWSAQFFFLRVVYLATTASDIKPGHDSCFNTLAKPILLKL
jgi:multisubunit Na+/H+ antiporter MnhC subunit